MARKFLYTIGIAYIIIVIAAILWQSTKKQKETFVEYPTVYTNTLAHDGADWLRIRGTPQNGTMVLNGMSIADGGGLAVGSSEKVGEGVLKTLSNVVVGGQLCMGPSCLNQAQFSNLATQDWVNQSYTPQWSRIQGTPSNIATQEWVNQFSQPQWSRIQGTPSNIATQEWVNAFGRPSWSNIRDMPTIVVGGSLSSNIQVSWNSITGKPVFPDNTNPSFNSITAATVCIGSNNCTDSNAFGVMRSMANFNIALSKSNITTCNLCVGDTCVNSTDFQTMRTGIPNTSTSLNVASVTTSGDLITRANLYVGSNANSNIGGTIYLGGTSNDNAYDNAVIESRQWGGADQSELLLFKGNDTAAVTGPDRIRLRAGEIAFDVYPNGTDNNRATTNIQGRITADGTFTINSNICIGGTMLCPTKLQTVADVISQTNFTISHPTTGQTWKFDNSTSNIRLNVGSEIKFSIYDSPNVYSNNDPINKRVGLFRNGNSNSMIRHAGGILFAYPFVNNNLDWAWYFTSNNGGFQINNDYNQSIVYYDSNNDILQIINKNDPLAQKNTTWTITGTKPCIPCVNQTDVINIKNIPTTTTNLNVANVLASGNISTATQLCIGNTCIDEAKLKAMMKPTVAWSYLHTNNVNTPADLDFNKTIYNVGGVTKEGFDFIIPVTGYYLLSFNGYMTRTVPNNQYVYLVVKKNGAYMPNNNQFAAHISYIIEYSQVPFSYVYLLNAGEKVRWSVYSNPGGALLNGNYVCQGILLSIV